MFQTLFFIPPWLFEGPLLVAWLVIGACYLAYLFYRHGNDAETWSFLPVFGIVALVIHYLLPGLGITGINPADPAGSEIPLGLAVRGYGLFLLLGIAGGVTVTLLRCRKVGLNADQVISLGFWMMLAGIAGARAFYVIQKRDEFFSGEGSFLSTLGHVFNMTEGGLVVYGSLIGGSIAAVIFLVMHKLPVLKVADLIAPGMVLGLAFGRIGCLMNGCCYGGVCEAELPSLRFPPGSPPYMHQLYNGELVGLETKPSESGGLTRDVTGVKDGSLAKKLGLEEGDQVAFSMPDSRLIRMEKDFAISSKYDKGRLSGFIDSERKGTIPIVIADDLPRFSLATHPTQVYSSINAVLLFATLWFLWTVRTRDGQVFGLMLIVYSISRFLIEIIRRDEAGQFGTQLTISQWVSLATVIIGFAVFSGILNGWSGRANVASSST